METLRLDQFLAIVFVFLLLITITVSLIPKKCKTCNKLESKLITIGFDGRCIDCGIEYMENDPIEKMIGHAMRNLRDEGCTDITFREDL